jgi:myo-inositol 2-dehydrogenase/D-chiro-inositol 1-dehydrogenase
VYATLKERISEARLVPISAVIKMNRGELRQPSWTGDASITGGFLYETPIHVLDIGRYLFGEPAEVTCRARTTVYNQLDDFSMLLTFPSDVTVTLTANAHATWLAPFERIEVFGDHIAAVTEEMNRLTFAEGLEVAAETLDFAQLPVESRWGYAEEDRRFVDAIAGEGPPAVSAADAFRTVELVERCYAAVRAH